MAALSWRIRSGIIMFHLTMPARREPAEAMRHAVGEFVAGVSMIGRPRAMEASTWTGGEHAHTWTGALDTTRATTLLEACSDLLRVQVTCDLHCMDMSGETLVILSGMTFWVQLAAIESPPCEPLEMTLALDTDIYLARTWGENRDNRVLAERNAPEFNRFLAQLCDATGAAVESVSADDYPGQLDEGGIILPRREW